MMTAKALHSWSPGEDLPIVSRPPISREDLVRYADASGDRNLIHLDDSFAKQAGFPSVIAHGMLSMAYLSDFVRAIFPEEQATVARIHCRFRKVLFPGESLSIGGEVKKVQDDQRVIVSLWLKNQAGEVTTDGEAEIQLK